ncbi:hypothetical protein HS088_TW08G00976 [Tripterygium wilfordii]|uniref:Uncharacterized protein n=2 Tax=Tripterygium wilfordii TaxID=458696 RepID=A0A7J7DDF7_TRIWF|nr:hypothetical protein HS088_TW08G00976 [Tripterygium wilfordii]
MTDMPFLTNPSSSAFCCINRNSRPNPHLHCGTVAVHSHKHDRGCEEATMSVEQSQRRVLPQIVKLDMASKLAEKWVNNMTRIEEAAPMEVESESQPHRLGLGAKVGCKTKYIPSDDPVEKKLHAKLEAEKIKAARSIEESNPSTQNICGYDESDEYLESRANAFAKKRAPPAAFVQAKKKPK